MMIARSEEEKWLKNSLVMSQFTLVSGLSGVGKTFLVQSVLSQLKSTEKRWVSLGPGENISKLLGDESLSFDDSLTMAVNNWSDKTIVIWDNYQFITQSVREKIISKFKNSASNCKHIFVGDEVFLKYLGSEISNINLRGFARSEIKTYLDRFEIHPESDQIETVNRQTGGLPLLINHWIQSSRKNTNSISVKYHDLSQTTRFIFQTLSLVKRALPETILVKIIACIDSEVSSIELELQSLTQTYFIEYESQTESYRSCETVSNIVWSNFTDSDKGEILQQLAPHIINSGVCSPYQTFYLAVEVNLGKAIISSGKQIEIQNLAYIHTHDLKNIVLAFHKLWKKDRRYKSDTSLLKIYQRAQFLLGNREQATQICLFHLNEISANGAKLSLSGQDLLLDLVHSLNRLFKTQSVLDLYARFYLKVESTVQLQLLIQYAVAISRIDIERGQTGFTRSFVELEAAPTKDKKWFEVAGLAHFEYARWQDRRGQWKDADTSYQKSYELFTKAKEPYISTLALFNRAWIALEAGRWDLFLSLNEQTRAGAEKYGYYYIQSGVDLLQAKFHRFHLQYDEAMDYLQRSKSRYNHSMPLDARYDLCIENLRLLLSLGEVEKLTPVIAEVKELLELANDAALNKRWAANRIEFTTSEFYLEDLLTKWTEPVNDGAYERLSQLAVRPAYELSTADRELFSHHPHGQIRLAEYDLVRGLHQSVEQIWPLLSQFEVALGRMSSGGVEKAAFGLLKLELHKKVAREQSFEVSASQLAQSDQFEIKEIANRLGGLALTADDKKALLGWAKALSSGGESRPDDFLEWKSSSPGTRERWRGWWRSFYLTESFPLTLTVNTGRGKIKQRPSVDASIFITSFEDLSEIYVQGIQLQELSRRVALQKFLNLLLEVFPRQLNKQIISMSLWGENYVSETHDPRIYTSVQRLRRIIGDPKCILNQGGAYNWNPSYTFQLIQSNHIKESGISRTQSLIIKALRCLQGPGHQALNRKSLETMVPGSEATLRRALADLVHKQIVFRQGQGPSVRYMMAQQ